MRNKLIAMAIMAFIVLVPFRIAYIDPADNIFSMFAFIVTVLGVFVSMAIFGANRKEVS
jgi:hypothetical protein